MDLREMLRRGRAALDREITANANEGVIEARLSLAGVLLRLGRINEARGQLDSARASAGLLHRQDLAAQALLQLAAIDPRRPADGLALLDQALPLARGCRRLDLVARIQTNRGGCMISLGHSQDALGPLGEALQIVLQEPEAPDQVIVRWRLAQAESNLGRANEAFTQISLALPIAESHRMYSCQTALLAQHASIDLELGRRGSALLHAGLAVEAAEKANDGKLVADSRLLLALALFSRGDVKEADEQIGLARRFYQETGDRIGEARLLAEVAYACRSTGLFSSMCTALADLEPLISAARGDENLQIDYLSLHSWAAEGAHDRARAERDLEDAIALADRGRDMDAASRLRARLAVLRRTAGRPGDAVQLLQRALRDVEGSRLCKDIWSLWYELGSSQVEAHCPSEAAESYDKTMRELVASRQRAGSRRIERLFPTSARSAFAQILAFCDDKGDVPGAFEVAELARQWRAAELAAATGGRIPHHDRIGRDLVERTRCALRSGELFVEYVLGRTVSYLFVVDRTGARIEHLIPASDMADLIGGRLALLRVATPLPALRGRLTPLSTHLLGPVLLGKGTTPDHLVIVPDGDLDRFPFEVLPVGGGGISGVFDPDGPLLVETTLVSYASSAATWLAVRSRSWPATVLTRAAAVLPGEAADRALAGTRREVIRGVEALAGATDRPTAPQGFEDAFLSSPSDVSLLHLALQAQLNAEDPDQTGLLFDEGRDAGELVDLRSLSRYRKHAKLSVVAAVREAGNLDASQMECALVDTLLASGSRSVLIPAWPLPDGETMRFMADLHDAVLAGLSVEEAVRRAKTEALHGNPTSPPYWSAFRLIGSGEQQIRPRARTPLWLIVVGLGLALFAPCSFALRHRRRRIEGDPWQRGFLCGDSMMAGRHAPEDQPRPRGIQPDITGSIPGG